MNPSITAWPEDALLGVEFAQQSQVEKRIDTTDDDGLGLADLSSCSARSRASNAAARPKGRTRLRARSTATPLNFWRYAGTCGSHGASSAGQGGHVRETPAPDRSARKPSPSATAPRVEASAARGTGAAACRSPRRAHRGPPSGTRPIWIGSKCRSITWEFPMRAMPARADAHTCSVPSPMAQSTWLRAMRGSSCAHAPRRLTTIFSTFSTRRSHGERRLAR